MCSTPSDCSAQALSTFSASKKCGTVIQSGAFPGAPHRAGFLLTDRPAEEVAQLTDAKATHPLEAKKTLGKDIVRFYYGEQAATLRPGTFTRLHLNQWQSGEEAFVSAEEWDGCVEKGLRPSQTLNKYARVPESMPSTRRISSPVSRRSRIV